ncbi:MAG TPA: hypothetical protein VKE73_04265 [Myxococcota bacterium]|nr:hypothetical protein [Myxococcota bacterium]
MAKSEAQPFGRRLYDGWLAIAARFGHVQTLVILSVFYAFVLGPISLGLSISRGDLLTKRGLRASGSAWRDADTVRPELERARRQF